MTDDTGTPTAFSRLHPTLQEALYRMRWSELRPIQVRTIHEVLDGDGDLIIAARTAAGKTEAAFLPILSRIVAEPGDGICAIYAGPLKALINDQFLRLERLCELAEIPVHKWHGDVARGAKGRLLDAPSGVLLITPESIESLFVNHAGRLAAAFAGCDFAVIDEMHSFLGTERGAHLRSLIGRLATKSAKPLRRVGLSATLGDMDAARRWLRPRDKESVALIRDESDEKVTRLRLSGYLATPARSRAYEATDVEVDGAAVCEDLALDLFAAFHGRTALIFANRKSDIEGYADFARREAARRGLRDLFGVHHGSLSRGEREDAEDALRSGRPAATFCSSTLEMGIDIGNVQAIGQVGPAWSVASMIQRLGRSGRKDGEAQEMRIFIEEDEPDSKTPLVDRLFPDLLQAIAMTELMVAERWCEPPDVDRMHISTFMQQVLSVIAESGGATAERLHSVLVDLGAFGRIDTQTFLRTLRDMGSSDLIEQTTDGLLILGMKGERIVRHHDFYTAFQASEEFRVSHGGRHIGNVALPPVVDGAAHIILAGRRWLIIDIDTERRSILVEPSPGGRRPSFVGSGRGEIHPRIREAMRSVLFRDDFPIYLDSRAKAMLARARVTAREAGLDRCTVLEDGAETIWLTWTGTRIQRTLIGLGALLGGLDAEDRRGIGLAFGKMTRRDVSDCYRRALASPIDPAAVAARFGGRAAEKYEPYLSDGLMCDVFGREGLDLAGAIALIAAMP